MIEQRIEVTNRLGLHARAASKLVRVLSGYSAHAWLSNGSREINAKSIMGVMLLAAAQGTTLSLRLDGEDELQAMAAVTDLFERRFDEDGE